MRRERNERTAEEEESIFLTLMSGGVGVGGVLSILSLIHSNVKEFDNLNLMTFLRGFWFEQRKISRGWKIKTKSKDS